MVQRHLRLLGPVSVEQLSNMHGDLSEEPRFRSRRTVALLGYLAAENRPVAREHLAALFWPDEESSKARANLRRELHNLSQILPECWHLERHVVAFEPSTKLTVDIYSLIELENTERWWGYFILAAMLFLATRLGRLDVAQFYHPCIRRSPIYWPE